MVMKSRAYVGVLVLGYILGLPTRAAAQLPPNSVVVNPATATMEFNSPDHNTVAPPGDVSAGQPLITGYQPLLFPVAADVNTGTPIASGTVIPKANVVIVTPATTPPTYRTNFVQAGFVVGTGTNQIPPCTVVAPAVCPVYTMLMVAVGPNNRTSPRGVLSESNPFLLASLVVTQPAAPGNVVVKP